MDLHADKQEISRFVTAYDNIKEKGPKVNRIYLTERDVAVDTPPGLKLQLLPHQKVAVKAMLDAEKNRRRFLPSGDLGKMTNEQLLVESNAIVLSEPYGSGKTFMIIAFILYCRMPTAFPAIDNSIILTERQGAPRNGTGRCTTEIIRRFTRINLPALIICGKAVLVQWRETLKQYTDLKFFEIGHRFHLDAFYEMYKRREHHIYDVILVKNDQVTGNFLLDSESAIHVPTTRSIVTVLSKMSLADSACWSTVVYDDFDVINIPTNTQHVHALFTIYVSATNKSQANARSGTNPANTKYNSVEECLEANHMKLTKAFTDYHLFHTFNVKNDSEFTEASTRIPIVKAFRYVYKNPDDKYIGLIDVIGRDDKNIAEMLNGDAIHTAASTLGIEAKSPIDIFQKMLDDKYAEFMKYTKLVEVFKAALDYIGRLPMNDRPHSREAIDKIIRKLAKQKSIKGKVERYSNDLLLEIQNVMREYIVQRDTIGRAVDRVKENLSAGECQVCLLPLEDLEIFIVKCCGLILCGECGIRSTNMGVRRDFRTNLEVVTGSCPQCRREIDIRKDFVFVNGGFDMKKIVDARGDESEVIVPIVTPPEPEIDPEIKNPKMRALLAIIRGQKPEAQEEYVPAIKNLMTGLVNIPPSANLPRKILVFANYDETLNNIKEFLTEQGVPFLYLAGRYQEMAATIEKFHTTGTVLLINSTHHCAGLNLQFATDLVFFHKLTDPNIEGQVAGRGQRIGRICNLHIHSLLYKNEAEK